MTRKTVTSVALSAAALLWSLPGWASWEVGLRVGADSNVTRSVDGETADTYLDGSVRYARDVPGDQRVDWTLAAVAGTGLYGKETDFNYASLSVAPGLTYAPTAGWTATLSPFLRGTTVRDSDQSSLAWGVQVGLEQRVGAGSYIGETYTYTDSSARSDVYSYQEHALGAYVGHDWTPSLSTELGYRFARGDSFRTVDSSEASASRIGPGGAGSGAGGRQGGGGSNGEVLKETVTSHDLTATIAWSWSNAVASYLGYAFASSKGDLGTSNSHSFYLGLGYRF